MWSKHQIYTTSRVTLHVSVWVEIFRFTLAVRIFKRHAPRERVSWNTCYLTCKRQQTKSRSTWACELKYRNSSNIRPSDCHAPRERVSWNPCECMYFPIPQRHAPRERVSWNNIVATWQLFFVVTLHVSVWVEILSVSCAAKFLKSHAPRERVSWN